MKKLLTAGLLIAFFVLGANAAPIAKAKAVNKPAVKKQPLLVKPKGPLLQTLPAPVAPAPMPPRLGTGMSDLNRRLRATPAEDSNVKVGGVLFLRWQKYLSGGTIANNFDVDRAYLDFRKIMEQDAVVRVTLDVARQGSSQLYDYLKYAYVEMPTPLGMAARLGLQQTVWTDWADKMLGLRYIAKSLIDNEGIMPSADFGVGVLGTFNYGNGPRIEYHATATNGNGYKGIETDAQKSVALRVCSSVYETDALGRITVGAFGNISGLNSSLSLSGNKQMGVMVGVKQKAITLFAESVYGTGISGLSAGGSYEFIPSLKAFLRMDNFDPNRSLVDNEINRSFYGFAYDWSKDIKFALDVQTVAGGSVAPVSAGMTTSAIYLHSMVTF